MTPSLPSVMRVVNTFRSLVSSALEFYTKDYMPDIKNKILFLFSACLLGFTISTLIFLPHLVRLPDAPSIESLIYLICALFGYQGLLWFALSIFSSPLFLLIRNNKLCLLYLTFLITSVNLFHFINLKIYSLYKFYLNISLIKYLYSEVTTAVKTAVLPTVIFVLPIIIAVSILIYFSLKYLAFLVSAYKKFFIRLNALSTVSIMALFIYAQTVHIIADIKKNYKITFWTRHIPYYYPITMKSFFRKNKIELKRDNYRYQNFIDTSISYPKSTICNQQKSLKKNIIFIVVDTLRADMLTPEIMPKTYSYIKKSKSAHVFTNHFSGGNATSTGLFSIFYAIPGTYYQNFSNSRILPLPIKGLSNLGYDSTLLFGAGAEALSLYKKGSLSLFPGVDKEKKYSPPWKNDLFVTKKFNKFLTLKKEENKHFFAFILYESPHSYSFPENKETLLRKNYMSLNYLSISNLKNPSPIFNRYINSVHFTDQLIGKILDKIDTLNLFEKSIVIITSDHGEEFNDNKNGYWGHNSAFSDYQLKVPLVIFDHKYPSKKHNKLTSHFDIFPYIFDDYLKCNNILKNTAGINILKNHKRTKPLIFASYSTMAFKDNNYTYVLYPNLTHSTFDSQYNQVFDQSFKPETYKKVLIEISKYYK